MPEYDIDRLVGKLRMPGPPSEEEAAAARRALQAAIRDEKTRVERLRRPLAWRFAAALGSFAPAAGVALAFALVVGSASAAASLNGIAATAGDGALVGAAPGVAAEVESTHVRMVSSRGVVALVSEHRVVRTSRDGSRLAIVTAGATGFGSRADADVFLAAGDPVQSEARVVELPPLPDPALLPSDPAELLAELRGRLEPGAPAGAGPSILDVAAEILLDPRLSAESRAAVIRSLGGIDGITRLGSGTGPPVFAVDGEVAGTAIRTSLDLTLAGAVVEHRVVTLGDSPGVPAGTAVFGARYGVPRLVEAGEEVRSTGVVDVEWERSSQTPGPTSHGPGLFWSTVTIPAAPLVVEVGSGGGLVVDGEVDGEIVDGDVDDAITEVVPTTIGIPLPSGSSEPETTLLEPTVSEVTTPGTTLPEVTGVTVPETTVPDVTIPDTTVLDVTTTIADLP